MNLVLAFPKVRRTYECRYCNDRHETIKREVWLFGNPVGKYYWWFMEWIAICFIAMISPLIKKKLIIKFKENANRMA